MAYVQEKNQAVYVTNFTATDTLLFSSQFAAVGFAGFGYAKDNSVLGHIIKCLGPSFYCQLSWPLRSLGFFSVNSNNYNFWLPSFLF